MGLVERCLEWIVEAMVIVCIGFFAIIVFVVLGVNYLIEGIGFKDRPV